MRMARMKTQEACRRLATTRQSCPNRTAMTPIKSAHRAFEVLELFQVQRTPLRLQDICSTLGYPASSASALLKSMVAMGYLRYDKAGRTYMPTMKIVHLGGWVQSAIFGDGALMRAMHALSQRFGETVTLAVQSDLHAQYVYLIQSRLPIWYLLPIGTVRPLTSSGSGMLMLAAKSDAQIRKVWKRIDFHRVDPARPTLAEVMEQVALCRRQDWIFSKHRIEPGAGGISVPLEDPQFGRGYALGIHGPVERLEARESEIVQALREAALAVQAR